MKKNKLKNIVLSLSLAFAMTAANADDFESSLVKFGDLDFVNTEDKNYQTYGDSETVKEEEDNTKNQCDTYGSSADDLVSEFLSTDCNSSIFPYYEGGQQDGGDPDDEIGAPPGSGAAKEDECTCGEKPYEWTGTPKGMWFPIRVVEIVRGDGSCTPTQGNSTNNMLSKLKKILLGGNSSETARGNQISSNGELGFKHFHSWKIDEDTYSDYTDDYYSPSNRCFNDNTKGEDLESSVDYAYWSSNNALKINLLYPEYTLIVGLLYAADTKSKFPVTTVLNTASCLIQTTGQGVRADDYVYWQGGCYPDNLPANGHFSNAKGLVDSSQLILQRSVMFSGRGTLPFSKESKDRGYASYGTVKEYMKYNICSAKPTMGGFPMKSHYKFSMLKPFTEAEDESDTSANSGNSEIDSSVNQENTNKAISSGNSSMNGMSSGTRTDMQNGGLSQLTGKIGSIGGQASNFIGGKLNELNGLTGQVTDWIGVTTKCAHRWGASSMRWGTGRNPRNNGEPDPNNGARPTETKDKDAVYIVWRWVECCEPNGDSGGGGGMKPGSGPF